MDADRSRSGAGFSTRRRSARLAIAIAVAVTALAGCASDPAPAPEASYGELPSFLPPDSVRPDSVLTGTADRPAVTSQGDPVQVDLAGVSVLATVTGPEVPGDGLPHQTKATTCTWRVTLTGPTADLPIRAADFTTLDHLGTVYRPALVPGKKPPPAVLTAGRTVSFEIRAVMTVGEGLLRWAPGGGRTVASWDFVVEND